MTKQQQQQIVNEDENNASGLNDDCDNDKNHKNNETVLSTNDDDDTDGDNIDSSALDDIAIERSLFTSGLGAAPTIVDKAASAADDDDTTLKATENGLGTTVAVVPVIDLSQGTDEELTKQLWDAATSVGFFTIIGHDISSTLIQDVFQMATMFFEQEQTMKEEQSPFLRQLNSGYEYMKQLRPSTGTYDQKESLQITTRISSMTNRWPTYPNNFQNVIETFIKETHKLTNRLLSLLEPLATPHVEPGTLANSHTLWKEEESQCTLRMLHYVPLDVATLHKLSVPDEEGRIHWRADPHTDWSNFTLLFQQMGQGGLECCANPRVVAKEQEQQQNQSQQKNYWIPVDPVPNGIAVNIGDMLARWSGGKLYSNLHRVRMPTERECIPPSSRYSIAYFAQSDKSTLITAAPPAVAPVPSPPPNDGDDTTTNNKKTDERPLAIPPPPPITAGDYLLSRIKSNFAAPVL